MQRGYPTNTEVECRSEKVSFEYAIFDIFRCWNLHIQEKTLLVRHRIFVFVGYPFCPTMRCRWHLTHEDLLPKVIAFRLILFRSTCLDEDARRIEC